MNQAKNSIFQRIVYSLTPNAVLHWEKVWYAIIDRIGSDLYNLFIIFIIAYDDGNRDKNKTHARANRLGETKCAGTGSRDQSLEMPSRAPRINRESQFVYVLYMYNICINHMCVNNELQRRKRRRSRALRRSAHTLQISWFRNATLDKIKWFTMLIEHLQGLALYNKVFRCPKINLISRVK